jgi:site-specific recombinase XerD
MEKDFYITHEHIKQYILHLVKKEYAKDTIESYSRYVEDFALFADGKPATQKLVEAWQNKLIKTHSARSVNIKMAALRKFTRYFEMDLKVKHINTPQRSRILPDVSELTKEEYIRLLQAANESPDSEWVGMVMRTMCALGIQVSELSKVTV